MEFGKKLFDTFAELPHTFSTFVCTSFCCVFKVIALVGSNQGDYFFAAMSHLIKQKSITMVVSNQGNYFEILPRPAGAIAALASDTASVWKSTMKGAVQSGRRTIFDTSQLKRSWVGIHKTS